MSPGPILAFALLIATPAMAGGRNPGLFIGSQHIGSGELNDFNPGMRCGTRFPVGTGPVEWHAEGGVVHDRYREVSLIMPGGILTRVSPVGPGELRVGASFGLAH